MEALRPFRLYNTLSRKVETFEPQVPGHVGLYVCGMTVYDHAHVGHARAMVVFDVVFRYLRHCGWNVTFVRNFTDVDDKIITRAAERGVAPLDLANTYIESFRDDMAALRLLEPTHQPRVSETIDEIVAMCTQLVERGHAYEAAGSVWFTVRSCDAYGKLSGQKVDELRSADIGEKRHPADFALWKAAKPGEPSWDSPWGKGRPGWHIECSAMSHRWLGTTIDIHGGGLDLVFPHHENEIAQSECAWGADYARYWMHNGLLTMARSSDGVGNAAKMGKSLGNVVNIRDALVEFPAEALRLYYLQTHYRSALPWSEEALPEALAMLARLYEAREVAEEMKGDEAPETVAEALGRDAIVVLDLGRRLEQRFHRAMEDDFNTSKALGHAFELARAINRLARHKNASRRGGPVVAPALAGLHLLTTVGLMTMTTAEFDAEVKVKRLGAMGLDREHIESLLAARSDARNRRDWSEADRLRDELNQLAIVVMDTPEGVRWRVRL